MPRPASARCCGACSAPGPGRPRNGHSVEYDLDPATGDRLLREAIVDRGRGDPASERPHHRIFRAGPNRYLHRGPDQRCSRRGARAEPADPDPCGPEHRRVPGDHAALWMHADRMARQDRRSGARHDHRPLHLPERSPVAALASCERLRAPARQRRTGRALPGRVRTERHRSEHPEPVHAGRHPLRHRHGQLPPQHARRVADGLLRGPHRLGKLHGRDHQGCLHGRDGHRSRHDTPARSRPAGAGLQGGLRGRRHAQPLHAAGLRTDPKPRLLRQRSRDQGRLRRRPAGRERWRDAGFRHRRGHRDVAQGSGRGGLDRSSTRLGRPEHRRVESAGLSHPG